MVLKRLVVFNLLLSTIVIIFFYYRFNIRVRAIPVHIIIVAYSLAFVYCCSILFVKVFSNRLSVLLFTILIISSQFFIINIYLGFFIAHENWGHPLTINILIVYLNEIGYLIESLPFSISKSTIYLSIFVLFSIVSIPIIFVAKKIYIDLKRKCITFFSKKNIIFIIVFFIIFPVVFFNVEWLQKRVSSDDPIVAFFLYEFSLQDEIVNGTGQENFIAKEQYPNNLDFDKKNVILIICDALRPDHLSYDGYNRNTTPFLDSISNLNNVYNIKNFFSTSSRSFIGIANILSSNYSVAHQNFFIHDLLKKQEYSINFILSGDHTNFFGLKKYYGKNIDTYYDGLSASKFNSNVSINDDRNILNKLNTFPDFNNKPTFFYLHYMSSHQLGVLDSSFKIYKPSKYDSYLKTVPRAILINDYDNRITQLDNYLKRTFSILNKKGYLKNSIVIISADHGQALGERGMVSHGNSTYLNETLIPLIILNYSESKLEISNKSKSDFYNQLDIAPTIIDLLNIPKPKTWNGNSIFEKRTNDFIFQQEINFYSCVWSENSEIYQYVYNSTTQKEEVFIINSNKYETKNIIDSFNKVNLAVVKSKLEKFYSLNIN
ncbi:MAG: hypothetical protein DRI75_08330 [Bacteroidetes bacterium]|nr:MAG: hypothetical protein DRI75_08330 [Bacteroidota bacterium]